MFFAWSLPIIPLEAVKILLYASLIWMLAVLVIEMVKAALGIIFAPE